ncbi:facilitated trehalose transporter Tret1-like [Cataglyphis hispanica]|uniref:facilitated trehalose transporter Tret1-like n=1 Tax=Cataglyphis hispanica TaxID=1086592 RepID=UPI0021807581|nr:facilitated trehalose transporter Tret1-like [Cataglyphis hispanica]
MEKQEELQEPGKLRQFVFAIIVNLSSVSYGFMMGWQSPSVPQLQNPLPVVGSEPMTDNNISWMNGILCLVGTFATMLLLVIPDKFSRKRFGYMLLLPMILSWLLIIFATEHLHIYIAKALSGITGAGVFFLVSNYVSEISCDSIRGILASLIGFSLNTGILLAYILGGMMSLYHLAVIGAILSALFLITFVFIPESPVYLVRENRTREAIKSLNRLKAGNTSAVEQALSHLQLQIKEVTSMRSAKLSDLFRDKATIKGLIIILGLFFGQQFAGIFAVISYTESIFQMAGSSLSPNTSSVIVGAIMLLGSFLSTSLIERMGRRLLLLISCVGTCTCHCVLGAFCYLQNLEYDISAYGWIPIAALSIFVIVYAVGMGNGPVVIMSEIFSRDVTSMASIVGLTMCWAASFVIIKTFADLIVLLGTHGCFFFLAICCACSFLFCFILVPETKGRTREDIVNELNGEVQYEKNKNVKHIIETDLVHATHV